MDVSGYRIYRSNLRNSDLVLIETISDPNDTVYVAPKDSVGGCYMITAFDASGNERTSGNDG